MNSPSTPDFPECPDELRAAALHWLSETRVNAKVQGVLALSASWQSRKTRLSPSDALAAARALPGRPERPELVSPLQVGHRSMRTVEGRAALIHALAHIEFNAINLALDAIWRFPGMPDQYYADWLQVATEEAIHFSLLSAHLLTQGFCYGDFPAHNSLGDMAAAAILDIILRDEIGHVATGNRWYRWLCDARGLDPVVTYASLAVEYKAPVMRGPFNFEARRAAGFSDLELTALKQ